MHRAVAGIAATVLSSALTLPLLAGDKPAEPERVIVQHILIAFKRSVPGKKIERTKEQAKALADELLGRARAGEDFGALVKQYTDDRFPGIFLLTNKDAPEVAGGRRREQMVPRFGDVAFGLAVSDVGLAAHHGALSPYGWHVIKRIE